MLHFCYVQVTCDIYIGLILMKNMFSSKIDGCRWTFLFLLKVQHDPAGSFVYAWWEIVSLLCSVCSHSWTKGYMKDISCGYFPSSRFRCPFSWHLGKLHVYSCITDGQTTNISWNGFCNLPMIVSGYRVSFSRIFKIMKELNIELDLLK